MDLHFTYTVNGLGFEDAKKDFLTGAYHKKLNL
jgi:hypothetical protein